MQSILRAALLSATVLVASCGDGGSTCGTTVPDKGVLATFAVNDETFQVSITSAEGVAQARATWSGTSQANIPNGLLVCEWTSWNHPWTWHLDPASVRLVEATIEHCDGSPSYVEANCRSFGPRYCPWGAEMKDLRDCDAGPDCPRVPR